MKKYILALLMAAMLAPAAASAQAVIRVGPPAPVIERPAPPPERGMVWISGYHRWDGNGYVWVPGHYDRPPRPRAVWVPHRWERHHGQWGMVEGHWR